MPSPPRYDTASVPKATLATIRSAARYPHCGHVNKYMSMTIQSGVRIEKYTSYQPGARNDQCRAAPLYQR